MNTNVINLTESICFTPFNLTLLLRFHDSIIFFNQIKEYEDLIAKQLSVDDLEILYVFPYCREFQIDGKLYEDSLSQKEVDLRNSNLSGNRNFPVPVFKFSENIIGKSTSLCNLSKNYKLYIISSNNGLYQPMNKFPLDCECMPDNWKHGYSKGIAINRQEQIIIYWIVVW